MMNSDLARTLDAIANQMQVVVGLTIGLRQSIDADCQKLVDLENAVQSVIRLLRRIQPKNTEGT